MRDWLRDRWGGIRNFNAGLLLACWQRRTGQRRGKHAHGAIPSVAYGAGRSGKRNFLDFASAYSNVFVRYGIFTGF